MKRILCYGDSNTWGAVPGSSGRHPEEVRWTGRLQKLLGADCRIIEEGYNGRTTVFDDPAEGRLSGLTYFGPCLDTQSPLDLVILMLGTNDMKIRFGTSPRTMAYSFGRYLDVLHTTPMAGNKPEVLLVSPIRIDSSYKNNPLFHDMFGENAAETSGRLSEAYREFAETAGIRFMDAAAYAHASKADGIHMDPEEHEKLAAAMAAEIRKILEHPAV